MSIKLYYYPNGGRAAVIRLLLNHGNVAFEDIRIEGDKMEAEFAANPTRYPMETVPVMEIEKSVILGGGDDKTIVTLTQSHAIEALAARLAGVAPKDSYFQVLNDDIVLTMEDTIGALTKTFGKEGEELKKARAELVSGVMTKAFKYVSGVYEQQAGPFLQGEQPTTADFMAFLMVGFYKSGDFDHIPTDFFNAFPRILALAGAVSALDSVKAFMAKHPKL